MNTDSLEVVILNDYASLTGGSSAVAISSAIGLANRGIPVTFLTCVGPVAPELTDVSNLEVLCLGQQEIAKNANRFKAFTDGLRNREATRAVRDILAEKSPENTVVHVHTWTKAFSPFALDAVIQMGFRLVVTLHDFFITCPSGGFFVHHTRELCRRVPLSMDCLRCNCDRRNYGHKLWRSVRTGIQNGFLRIPEKISYYIGVSDFSVNVMRPYLPPTTPVRVVRNPVDCKDEGPAAVADNDEFVFIGRFEEEKGVKLFADAVRAAGVKATFIGDGALAPYVHEVCPESRFTGWLKPLEIRQYLKKARALVFPPLWYETLGLVVIEAAAAGVPAIISNQCAATDYIRNGTHGLHFEHGSVESLARRMTELLQNNDLTARLGRAAYDWYWRDPWTSERHVTELVEIYEELVARAPAPIKEGVSL